MLVPSTTKKLHSSNFPVILDSRLTNQELSLMRLVCGKSKILTPWNCPGFLLLGLALQCSVLLTGGIQLENVTVPPTGRIGDSIVLECEFHLDSDKLYSLKWYKDGHEFFRYVPNSRPSIATFPVSGVQLDKQQLNVNRVTLRNIGLNSSGVYKCEVSSESPIFRTLFKERNLTVIIPPDPQNPRLSQFPRKVHMQDIVEGNCTSYKSFPAANLTFSINDAKWTRSNVTVYEPVSEIGRDGSQVFTSVLGLRFRVENSLFHKGSIRIKCVASILGDEYEAKKNITHQNYHPPLSSSGRNQYSSGSPILRSKESWTFTACCLSIQFTLLFHSPFSRFESF